MRWKGWTLGVLCLGLTLTPMAEELAESAVKSPSTGSPQLIEQSLPQTLTFTQPVVLSGERRESQSGQTTIVLSEDGENSAFLWDASESRVELQADVPYFVLHADGDYIWLGGYRGIYVLPKARIEELGSVVIRGGFHDY